MHSIETTSPQPKQSRLLYLDFLRGIAVLGLLTMNISYMGLLSEDVNLVTGIFSDQLVLALQSFFLDGRFRSIFCLLLGIGLHIQFTRYQALNKLPSQFLKPRLHWLFVIGLCHCIFIWYGDILIVYALSGLVVIRNLEEPTEKILKRGYHYFSIGMVIYIVINIISFIAESDKAVDSDITLMTYVELYSENLLIAVVTVVFFPIIYMFYICGVMYIGIGLFRKGLLQKGFNRSQVWWLAIITVVLSLIDLMTLLTYIEQIPTFRGTISSISGLTMGLLIWHWVLISKCYMKNSIIIQATMALGRRALSFYILQSLVMTTLLRFIFPEWNNEFTLIHYLTLAVAFIPVQLCIAHYYDRAFKQGPLEYCWRKLATVKPD